MEFYSIKKEKNDIYSCNGKNLIEKMITLADPTYDLTFKYLFSQQKFEKVSGIDRSASLLNTLIYQNAIEKIQELNTEFVKYNMEKNNNYEPLRLLRSDLAFKIKLNDKNESNLVQLVNIEMQIGYPINFLERLVEYGLSLKERNKGNNKKDYKTLVLGFINYKGNINLKSNSYYISEFNSENDSFIKKVDDFPDIVIINLFEISKKLENNEKIYIYGKEIGDIGKNWLKLLSIRHWAKKINDNTFEIPWVDSNKEINSAVNYLRSVKGNDLSKYYLLENEYYNGINKAAEILAEDMVKEKVKKAKMEAENENLKKFLNSYKNLDYSLEFYENTSNINFSELDMEKVIAYWGNEEKYEEKLKLLTDFIGKKRKNNTSLIPK